MIDEKQNKKQELRGFVRPSKSGASLDTQEKALKAAGVNPDYIYQDYKTMMQTVREGDTVCLYDLFYMGTTMRKVAERWIEILDKGATIDMVRENEVFSERMQRKFANLLKRTVHRVGKDRIRSASASGNVGRKEKFDEVQYRNAFDLWNESESNGDRIAHIIKRLNVSSATFYSWIDKYLVKLMNQEVPHAPITPQRLQYLADLRGIRKNREGIYSKKSIK